MTQLTHAAWFRMPFVAVLEVLYLAVALLVTLWPTTGEEVLNAYVARVM